MTDLEEVKADGGAIMVRLTGMATGTWLNYSSPIDALLAHVKRELLLEGLSSNALLYDLAIPAASVSRCRHGQDIPDAWLLRMHEYSGIPVAELRQLARMESATERHPNARPSRPVAGVN